MQLDCFQTKPNHLNCEHLKIALALRETKMNRFIFTFIVRTKLKSVKTSMTVTVDVHLKQLCAQNFKEIEQHGAYKRDLMGAVSRLDTFASICSPYKIEDFAIEGCACRTRWNEKLQVALRNSPSHMKSQMTIFVNETIKMFMGRRRNIDYQVNLTLKNPETTTVNFYLLANRTNANAEKRRKLLELLAGAFDQMKQLNLFAENIIVREFIFGITSIFR
ncbi:hypothetical protein EG68_11594 [Paragonimus skrjabini miyazakii]|uniref:Uncharacterized protein n=1 Tax=Paragonimus skrjabini miyazakii TaxID=59628 RepID=A0A8S9YIU1_9TREM|nr:hypothetical protein EG68_11594 [Paragonimus skrjabini miyazakii]